MGLWASKDLTTDKGDRRERNERAREEEMDTLFLSLCVRLCFLSPARTFDTHKPKATPPLECSCMHSRGGGSLGPVCVEGSDDR